MSRHPHDDLRESLGAYVLGHLDAGEAVEVEQHLAECPDCRAEYAEIAPAAAALADLKGAFSSTPASTLPSPSDAAPPADLGERIVGIVEADERHERRRRLTRAAALTALAAAVAAVGIVVGLRITQPETPPTVPLEAVSVTERAETLDASADLIAHTWGVEVRLTATGFTTGERYTVTVHGTDGVDYPAGAFVGTGTKRMVCNLNSAVLREAADGFEVRDPDGRVLLASRF